MSVQEIIAFYNEKEYNDLEKSLRHLSNEQLMKIINETFMSSINKQSLLIVKAVLSGCLGNCKCHSREVSFLYKEAIKLFQTKDANQELAMELHCILTNEVNNLEGSSLADLCEFLLALLMKEESQNGLPHKLFRKIIDVLPQHSSIHYDDSVMSGVELKLLLVKKLCSFKWPSKAFIHIVTMLKELELPAPEADQVVKKAIEKLQSVAMQELPPLIFQVLSLATSHNKAQKILEGIVLCINSLNESVCEARNETTDDESSGVTELKQIEGTILLYVGNTMKQNQFLGKSFLKMLKGLTLPDQDQSLKKLNLADNLKSSTQSSLSSFFIALSMLLVQDGKFCMEVLGLLRSLILKFLQDSQRRIFSRSLCEKTAKIPDVINLFCQVVNNCAQGWEHILNGLLQLGFNLMSAFGPKQGPFGKGFSKELRNRNDPHSCACDIGLRILSTMFKTCKLTRDEIVKKIINHIQSNFNAPSYHFIKLLKAIIKSYPYAVLQCSEQLKIMLDDVSIMHPFNTEKLFAALMPLLKINSNFRSSVILVLRKALSSRSENSRLCALQGFLIFLENFPLTEATSLSQISSQSTQSIFSSASIQTSTQHSSPGAAHNRMLCMEIVQAIRRCLTQQHAVRAQLYCGIHNVIMNNPRLSSVVVETLFDHLQLFYEEDSDIIPPVSLALCLSKSDGAIQEPLPLLLATLSAIIEHAKTFSLNLGDDEIIDEDILNRVESILNSISTRLCKCEVDDFNIRTSSPSESSSGGWASVLVLALHQVLIEYWISTSHHSRALELFQSYKKFHTAFTQNRVANFDKMLVEMQLQSCSIANISAAVSSVLSEDENELSQSENFSKHIMSVLHTMLMQLSDHGFLQGASKKKVFDELLKISRLCYHKFLIEKNAPDHCHLLLSCLECFHIALKFVISWHPNKLSTFISTVCGDEEAESQLNTLPKLIKQFQRVLVSFVGADGPMSAITKKLVTELLSLLEVLFTAALNKLPLSENQQFAEWWLKLCIDYEIEDVFTSKRIVQLHLVTALHTSEHPEIPFRDLCTDISISLRPVEEQGESQRTYKIATLENSSHLVPIIMKHLDSLMADSDWLLAYIKGAAAAATNDDDLTDEAHENRRKIEGSLCIRTCTIGVGLLDLLASSMSSVPAIDAIINSLTTLFNFLTQFSKYYLFLYAQSYGNIPSKFEKLTSFVGSEMMRPIYAFIMHAQSIQTSKLSDGKSKKNASGHTAGKAKVLRDSKGISRLVFAIEQNEHNLIMLARRSKIELMKDYHLPTSRDFRIRTDVINVAMNEQDADKENNVDASLNEDEGEDFPTASKRPRLDA